MRLIPKTIQLAFAGLLCALQACSPYTDAPIRSGEIWPDDRGEHINAHGGGILVHDGTL